MAATQAELAAQIGTSQAEISKLERGEILFRGLKTGHLHLNVARAEGNSLGIWSVVGVACSMHKAFPLVLLAAALAAPSGSQAVELLLRRSAEAAAGDLHRKRRHEFSRKDGDQRNPGVEADSTVWARAGSGPGGGDLL